MIYEKKFKKMEGITLYNVTSTDGYIAKEDGSEDFIPEELWVKSLEIFNKFDTLVMGRKTYDAIQKYEDTLLKPFENLNIRKIILTKDNNFKTKAGYETRANIDDIKSFGKNVLVSSGPEINNQVLQKKLVYRIILHQLPNKISSGIKPFEQRFFEKLKIISKNELGLVKEIIYET